MWQYALQSAMVYSSGLALGPEVDPIAHLGPPDVWLTTGRYRYVPPSYLASCDLNSDAGAAHLLYLRSLISDESEE
jgi:hypothetical protein